MTQSHHTDHHHTKQTETNTHHPAEHVAAHVAEHAHEVPANAPLLEGSGPKDWEEQFGPSVAIFSALANPLRLAIAHHLRILREAHVIDREQRGRATIYRLKDHHISHIVLDVYEHTREHHAD